MRGRNGAPVSQRFHEFVNKTESCWIWTGSHTKNGYGQLWFNNKTRLAHRICWELHYGCIPPSMLVLHKCDVRNCVKPEHLFLGTHRENTADMMSKGRWKGR